MRRPMWMTESTVLLLGSALIEPFRYSPHQLDPASSSGRAQIIGLLVNFSIFAAVSWFLWNGRNWARWITFLILILCLLELPSVAQTRDIGKLLSSFYDAGLAVFMFFFLNTRSVRDWFRGKSTAVAPPPIGVSSV